MTRHNAETLAQYQHGNISVKEGHLSIGLIFCNVTQSLIYDSITSKRILDRNFHTKKRKYLELFDETFADFKENK